MTPDRLRAVLQGGVLALLVLAPLPFGSVEPGAVLAIELTAAALGLGTILLLSRDFGTGTGLPNAPLAICVALIALGMLQIVPIPFSIATRFSPTADLARALIPHLGLDRPPAVSWSVAAPETTDAVLRLVADVLIGLTAAVAFDSERSRRRLAAALVTAAVFQAVYGSGEYLTGRQHIFGFAKKYDLDSATGTFINRNHMATMLAMALPFALALAIGDPVPRRNASARSWRERVVGSANPRTVGRMLAFAATALLWLGLLLSHSRAGLIAGVVAAAVFIVRFRRIRGARWAAAIGAGVLLALLSVETAQAPGERFFSLRNDVTVEAGRPAAWRDAMGLVAKRPAFGWGYGTFESIFPLVQSAHTDLHYSHAHSDWLEWTIEGGVPVLGAAIALLVLALRGTRSTRRDTEIAATIPVACRAAIVAVALHAAWDFSLRIPSVAAAAAAVVGFALTRPTDAVFPSGTSSAFSPAPEARSDGRGASVR